MPAAPRVCFDGENVKPEFNQYWYSQLTIDTLVSEVEHHATRCAFLSTPSLFFALDRRRGDDEDDFTEAKRTALRDNSILLDYDTQWTSDPCCVPYDFRFPDRIPVQHIGTCDYVVVDPPFITEDVWTAYIFTTKLLLKEGGRVLFTTVLENHAMLEGLMNGPLFIPRFQPCVRHLSYQYVCFLNYEATRLQGVNPELVADAEPKLLAAIQMANDIRHSEKAFAVQMAQRPREGEAPLPTAAHERDKLRDDRVGVSLQPAQEVQRTAEELAQIPMSDLPWAYVPEGLSMYAEDSNTMPVGGASGSTVDDETLGPVYAVTLALRSDLGAFKSSIDNMQRLLDVLMRIRIRHAKLKKELPADTSEQGDAQKAQLAESENDVMVAEANRHAHLDKMQAHVDRIVAAEEQLRRLKAANLPVEGQSSAIAMESPVATTEYAVVSYQHAMLQCIEAYRSVAARKTPLQELAADATRKYKSPVFSRMQELMRELKDLKKVTQATAVE